MARYDDDPSTRADVETLGRALAELRREAGLSQAEAGRRAGMTSQGWGLYESGRRPGLFRPDVQRRLTAAVDAGAEDLALRAAVGTAPAEAGGPAKGVAAPGRPFRPEPVEARAGLRRRVLADDALAPWAARGVTVEYRLDLPVRPGDACAVELVSGTVLIGRLEADGDPLKLSHPASGVLALIERRVVAAVGRVTGRLEAE